jgi:outer membrane protein assembly factor BamB
MKNRAVAVILAGLSLLPAGACFADDWPQFRGPNRDGKSAETGLLRKWPAGGPQLLWSVDGLGKGFTSVAVAEGIIYTTGMFGRDGFLFAYDLDGRPKWKVPYGPEFTRSYPGTRATPTVNEGRVYIFSGTGVMHCLDAKTGKKLWGLDIIEKFEGSNINWGITGSPLIVGEKLICTPGGKKGTMVALDKTSGRTIWATESIGERSAYCSPILIERGGRKLIINMVQESVICVDAEDGGLVWRYPYKTPYDTGTVTPVYHDGRIFVTSVVQRDYTPGGLMLEMSEDGTKVTRKWSNKILDCHHGHVILLDGYLYGACWNSNTTGDWLCLDWETGTVMYEHRWNGNKGSLIYADGMFYCYDENTGDVALVKPSPDRFDIAGSFRVTRGSGKHWAHPAISDGRLYIRHGNALMAYDIKSK